MKIIEMRPELTEWRDGQSRKVSSWSFHDKYQSIGAQIREIWHYTTKMGEFVGFDGGEDAVAWAFMPESLGIGSATDQQGMNQLMSTTYLHGHGMLIDYGYRYSRDRKGGGPRIETLEGQEVL